MVFVSSLRSVFGSFHLGKEQKGGEDKVEKKKVQQKEG